MMIPQNYSTSPPQQHHTHPTTTDVYHVMLYLLASTTLLANLVFILTILLNQPLRTCSNYLLLSNSYADILVGIDLLPAVGVDWVTSSTQPLTQLACLIWFINNNYVYAVSIAHMTAISLERFLRVFHTSFHRRWIWKLTIPMLLACWLVPLSTTYLRLLLPGAFNPGIYSSSDNGTTCPPVFNNSNHCVFCTNQVSIYYGVALEFVLPMLVSVAVYVAIVLAAARRIRATERLREKVLHGGIQVDVSKWRLAFGPVERLATSPEYRSIRLYSAILLVFIISWAPHSVNRLWLAVTGRGFPDPLTNLHEILAAGYTAPPGYYIWSSYNFRCVTNLVGSANSLINPLFVFVLSPSFRSGFIKMIAGCRDVILRQESKESRSNSRASLHSLDTMDVSRLNELANHFCHKLSETDV